MNPSVRFRSITPHLHDLRCRMRRGRLLLACLLLPLLACASAQKRLEQGIEFEQQGQYAAAADRYIQALEKEPGHEEARRRLIDAGGLAIADYLDEADRHLQDEQLVPAADALQAAQDLLWRAAGVDVNLAVPDDFEDRRRAVLDGATQWLFEQASYARKQQEWEKATRYYARIQQYEPDPQLADRVQTAWFDTEIGWGYEELGLRRFRSAHRHAEAALAVLGGADAPGAGEALALRSTALEQGTITVGLAPLWRTDAAALDIPEDFLTIANDALELDHWSSPPPFVDTIDPFEFRRELRNLGYLRVSLDTHEAARIGRQANADYVVTAMIESFVIENQNVKEETRSAETGQGVETSYIVQSGTHRYRLRCAFTIVDSNRQNVAQRGDVMTTDALSYTTGIYAGNIDQLELSGEQRLLFDLDDQAERRHEMENRLAESMSRELAERVFEKLLGLVD